MTWKVLVQSTLAFTNTAQLIVLQENKLLESGMLRYSQGKEFVFVLHDLVMTLLKAESLKCKCIPITSKLCTTVTRCFIFIYSWKSVLNMSVKTWVCSKAVRVVQGVPALIQVT